MKRIKYLLIVMLLFCGIPMFAADFEVDGICYNVLSREEMTCEVTNSGRNYSGELVIPASVSYGGMTFKVEAIGENAFNYFTGWYNFDVIIEDGVKKIGRDAFFGSHLRKIVIPRSITAIGDGALSSSYLKEIHLSDIAQWLDVAVSYLMPPLGYDIYLNGELLTELHIPNEIEVITPMFRGCVSLKKVFIPNTVTLIHWQSFQGCKNLESINIPESITQIGGLVFDGCSSLKSISLPKSIELITTSAFRGCVGLKEFISHNPTPPLIVATENPFDGISKIDCVLKVPEESVEAYKAADYWKDFWNIVGIDVSGVDGIATDKASDAPAYNLSGQQVGNHPKGIIIKNGRKAWVK